MWKSDSEHLFNGGQDNTYFDNEHLEHVKEEICNPDSPTFSETDCSVINSPISREEVRASVLMQRSERQPGYMKFRQKYYVMITVLTYCLES